MKEGEFMELRVGDTWYGKQGTIYEDIQATIDDITARYVQVFFIPTLNHNGHPMRGMPLGKRHFHQNFDTHPPYFQLTLFNYFNE